MLRQIFARRIRRAPMIIVGCLAIFAGTVWARAMLLKSAWWLWLVLPFVLWALRKHGIVACLLVVVLCFGVGWWRGTVMVYRLLPYQRLAQQQVTVVGRATSDGAYDDRKQLVFTMEHIAVLQPMSTSLPGSITVGGFAPAVYRGDIVQVTGKLYPTRGNNLATINFAELKVLRAQSSVVDTVRRHFAAGLQSALPEPLASFGLGLLVGQRATLPADVSHQLVMVGLTHIIAVSGYNLTIMVEVARRILGKRSKFQTAGACVLLILTFLLCTGNSPSIVRASIISLLGVGTWYYGRAMKPVALLLLAAAITVLANPMYLWGNVSWYLSFLAFFGVVVIAPLATERMYHNKAPPILVKMVIESLAAEVMTLPYVLFIFGQMSTVGLLANLLVAVFVPLAMLLCVVAGIAGMLVPALAGWVAWPATLLLTYMLDMAGLLSRIPYAFIEALTFSLAALLVTYGSIGVIAWIFHRRIIQARGSP